MHVLFDARLLHRPLSGLERVQRNVIRELAARDEIDRLRVVVTAGTDLPPDFPANAEVVEVRDTEDILAELLPEEPDDRPDLYHLTWFPDRSPRDLLLLAASQACVVEVHDAILNRHPEYHPNHKSWAWYDDFVKQLVANADRLLVHSASVAAEVERDLLGDVNDCDIAPLAVDPSLHDPVSDSFVATFQKQHGIGGDYFVALGKDYPHKDHATLFRALARLPSEVSVIVAGDKVWHNGKDTDDLLARLGIESRVRWFRGLSDDEVKALLQGSRGLVYPSLEEGFGLPPIEAMLCGVPVLAARSMSIPEVCGDGAWLFEPGDDEKLAELMTELLAGSAAVTELIARGTRRAARFSWERCADQVIVCYRSACKAAADRRDVAGGTRAMLESIARCPRSEASELAAWQNRCRFAERALRDLKVHRDEILTQLQEFQAKAGLPVTPRPVTPRPVTPPPVDNGSPRPRWSLRRRIRKIREGLRRMFPHSSER